MLQAGQKIIVFDANRVELGEGTFMLRSYIAQTQLTVYECQEHTILAKGAHFIKIGERTIRIDPSFDK